MAERMPIFGDAFFGPHTSSFRDEMRESYLSPVTYFQNRRTNEQSTNENGARDKERATELLLEAMGHQEAKHQANSRQ